MCRGTATGSTSSRRVDRAKYAILTRLDPKDWSVYIARCADGSLYTGIAKDVAARLKQHNDGRGAAYTRARRPVVLAYIERGMTRSEALAREARIKSLPRAEKCSLVEA
jgi:putative endonuclease